VLSQQDRAKLDSRLEAYEAETGHQLAVLTMASLDGDTIEDFSIRTAEAWKLGSKERDDGVLLLVALAERRMRIEVGYGLEGQLPDALAGRIIRQRMAPAFQRGDYARGIADAVEAIIGATGGIASLSAPSAPSAPSGTQSSPQGLGLLVALIGLLNVFVVFRVVWSNLRRKGARDATSVGWSPTSSRSGGGFGSGSSGGGSFSGGGDSFGGGGASGGW
jgi:uncharacterized protein